jgi:hypothetical protein
MDMPTSSATETVEKKVEPNKPGQVLKALYESSLKSIEGEDDRDRLQKERWRKALGKNRTLSTAEKRSVKKLHKKIQGRLYAKAALPDGQTMNAEKVIELLDDGKDDLKYLLSLSPSSLLHELLDFQDPPRENFPHLKSSVEPDEQYFETIKPVIRLLLQIEPDFPEQLNSEENVPLYMVMNSLVAEELKSKVVQFLCRDKAHEGLASEAAIKSLGMRNSKTNAHHALHLAIEHGVEIDVSIVKSSHLSKKLEFRDKNGQTCLHKAVDPPGNDTWAKCLVDADVDLLLVENKDQLTPLQYLIEKSRSHLKQTPGQAANTLGEAQEDRSSLKKRERGPEKEIISRSATSADDMPIPNRQSKDGEPRNSDRVQQLSGDPVQETYQKKAKDVAESMETWLKVRCLMAHPASRARSAIYPKGESKLPP